MFTWMTHLLASGAKKNSSTRYLRAVRMSSAWLAMPAMWACSLSFSFDAHAQQKPRVGIAVIKGNAGAPNPRKLAKDLALELGQLYEVVSQKELRAALVAAKKPPRLVMTRKGVLSAAQSLELPHVLILRGQKKGPRFFITTQLFEPGATPPTPLAKKRFGLKTKVVNKAVSADVLQWVLDSVPSAEPATPEVASVEETESTEKAADGVLEAETLSLDTETAPAEPEIVEETPVEAAPALLEEAPALIVRRTDYDMPALRLQLGTAFMQRMGTVSQAVVDANRPDIEVENPFQVNGAFALELYPLAFGDAPGKIAGLGLYAEGRYGSYVTRTRVGDQTNTVWSGRGGLAYRYPLKHGGVALRLGVRQTHFPFASGAGFPNIHFFHAETGVLAELPIGRALSFVLGGYYAPFTEPRGRSDGGDFQSAQAWEVQGGPMLRIGIIEASVSARYGQTAAEYTGASTIGLVDAEGGEFTDATITENRLGVWLQVGIRLPKPQKPTVALRSTTTP